MPWTIVESHPDCTTSEVAVVKEDADGNADMDELEGCHATEDDALDQIAALEASEENAMDALDTIEAKLDGLEEEAEPQRKSAVGERRTMSFETKGLEVKDDGDEEFVFEGYGAVFGNTDRGGDVIEKGAFQQTINRNDGTFPLLADHEMKMQSRLGVVNAKEDRNGVKVTGHINTEKRLGKEAASDIRHAMKHGDTIGMSFGYEVKNDEYDSDEDVRILKEVKTHEFSLTQIPMNPQAEVTGVKAFLEDESALQKLARKIAPMLANDERMKEAFGPASGDESATDSATEDRPSVAELKREMHSFISELQANA